MPKKRVTKVIKKVVKKTAKKVAKKPLKPKSAAPKKKVAKPVKRSAAASRPVSAKPPVAAPKPVELAKPDVSLGRPLVTQEEKLYMLFHNDYQSRQVFEFLRVETVKELEEFSPQQIVHLMSRPIRMTVDRIRQRLAEFKRALKGDEEFAAQFRPVKPGTNDGG